MLNPMLNPMLDLGTKKLKNSELPMVVKNSRENGGGYTCNGQQYDAVISLTSLGMTMQEAKVSGMRLAKLKVGTTGCGMTMYVIVALHYYDEL